MSALNDVIGRMQLGDQYDIKLAEYAAAELEAMQAELAEARRLLKLAVTDGILVLALENEILSFLNGEKNNK